jgi:RNA polymerase sigma factor (sigma-70 family)
MAQQANDGTANPFGDESAASQTDEQLMLACERGEKDAFTALFLRYQQPLFGFFRRRVADPSLAEELTQETFIAILRRIDRYQPLSLFRTYLYAIAYRILRSHRRKAFFRAGFSSPMPIVADHPVNAYIETDALIREALGKLDKVDREILLLREFEELSYVEIATVLRTPVNTVRSRLFRARTALRELLLEPPPRTAATDLSITKEQA